MKHIGHTKHYWRAAFLLVGAIIASLIFRAFLVPESFGEYGYYRGSNIAQQMAKPVSFAKPGSCADCHDQVSQIHENAAHQAIQCQNCHAPLSKHVVDGEMIELMPINRSPDLCLRCHRLLPSRPKDFPQIETKKHLKKVEEDLLSGACLKCHHPHDPTPGTSAKTARGNKG